MQTASYITVIAVLAASLHALIGWPATLLAGMVAAGSRAPIRVGALGVGLAWTGWVVYSFFVSDAAVLALLAFLSDATGGAPPVVIALLPTGLGIVWGGASGALGAALRTWITA